MRNFIKIILNFLLGPLGIQITKKRKPSTINHVKAANIALGGSGEKIFVDVGAHYGESILFIRKLFPSVKILACEPNPQGCRAIEALKIDNLSLIQAAVGEFASEMTLNVYAHSMSSSLLNIDKKSLMAAPFDTKKENEVKVPVKTLDEICNDILIIDYLKIDVQGFEDKVLKGGAKTLLKTRYLIIEGSFNVVYEGQCLVDSICYLLWKSGFRLINTIGYLPGNEDHLISADLFFERSNSQ